MLDTTPNSCIKILIWDFNAEVERGFKQTNDWTR